jgi:hypothetical protein
VRAHGRSFPRGQWWQAREWGVKRGGSRAAHGSSPILQLQIVNLQPHDELTAKHTVTMGHAAGLRAGTRYAYVEHARKELPPAR